MKPKVSTKIKLNANQYYSVAQKKTQICLHHTAGGSASSSASWWDSKPDHVSTPYLIDRDGTIYELYNPSFWAYSLGLTNGTAIEKRTIPIEICSYGGLIKKSGKYYRQNGSALTEIPKSEVIEYKEPHRGFIAFERYTDAQVQSTINLVKWLAESFGISVKDIANFWYFGAKSKGLVSHTTLRKDKSDIHPQPNLIKGLYDLFGVNVPVIE